MVRVQGERERRGKKILKHFETVVAGFWSLFRLGVLIIKKMYFRKLGCIQNTIFFHN
jgi:hypothetical protein